MNVTLAPDLERLLNDKLEAGEYRSADEVINAAMRLFRDREEDMIVLRRVNAGDPLPIDERYPTRLEALLEEAEGSGEPTEMTSEDWDDVERDAVAALNSRKTD
jgi:putative addiction module CopG family antidote